MFTTKIERGARASVLDHVHQQLAHGLEQDDGDVVVEWFVDAVVLDAVGNAVHVLHAFGQPLDRGAQAQLVEHR